MTKALFKDTVRAIGRNFSRYISILLIVALGTCFFVGVKATSPDMFSSAEKYFSDCNLMDIRLQSSIGFSDEDVATIAALDGIEYAKGQRFVDALVLVNGEIEADIDGSQISTRAYGFDPANVRDFLNGVNDGSYINRIELLKGRYPTSKFECLVDASELSTPESYKIGNTITLTGENSASVKGLDVTEFTIVGIIRTPYYLSYERGNTNIGSGKIGTFIYIPDEAFSLDYYSEVYATVAGADLLDTYSDDYNELVNSVLDSVKEISDIQITRRVQDLKPELEQEIVNAQMKIDNSSGEAKDALVEIDSKIEQLQMLVDNGTQMIADAQAEFDSKFADVTNQYNSHSEEYNQAIREYSAKRLEFDNKNEEYLQKSQELTAAQKSYDTIYSQWQQATATIASAQQTITQTQSMISAGEAVITSLQDIQTDSYSDERIQAVINMMQTTYPDLYNSVKALTATGLASEVATSIAPFIDEQKTLLAQQQALLDQKKTELENVEKSLSVYQDKLNTSADELTKAKAQLDKAEKDLNEYYSQLVNGGYQLQTGELEIQVQRMSAESQLNTLKENVASAPTNLSIAKSKREEIVSTLDSGLLEAENNLQKAKDLYAKLDSTKWSFYTRQDTPGFTSFGESVMNIEVLSNIFPIFFFLISSLVCLITMTRMIEEDRTLVGTYKALGYSSASIILKYVIYAFSACIFGSVLGIASGIFIFPYAINTAYSIIYTIPSITYNFPVGICGIGFGISLLCTCIATTAALMKELTLNPSKLMRPKAPKNGKRVFLEKITVIWQKLNFSSKVTARNLARNKNRAVMTILGVAGCTAMLIASLGMYDSINAITVNQYSKNPVSLYDFQVMFEEPQAEGSYEFGKVATDTRVSAAMLVSMKSMTASSQSASKKPDVYLLVPENIERINDFICLRDRKSGEKYTLDDKGVIITEKLAKELGLGKGDFISISDSDGNSHDFMISNVAENYVFNYVYCSPAYYRGITQNTPEYTFAMGKVIDAYKTGSGKVQSTTKSLLTTDFTRIDRIAGIAFTEETTESITQVAETLSVVILIFFFASLILAFVVLYNISNINIIERNRELATLKVLGFVDREVKSYIYRETIINSLAGIAAGIGLGFLLHKALITFTAIDTVMYGQSIEITSYLMAIAISVIIIAFVSIALNRKVMRINMVSSLKSVE